EQHLPVLVRLLGGSAYLSEILLRQGKDWLKLFLCQTKITQKSVAQQLTDLEPLVKSTPSLSEFCAGLRQHKQREYLRIGARDLMASVTLEETVRELSALADASLDAAYRFCRAAVEKDYGVLNLPGTETPNRFVILGMGKLGGDELNFSSDVDVIFLYENDESESSGGPKGKADPRAFFAEVGKKIIQAMGQVTEDGFVFRIDLRLRPLGANGPLVQSVHSAMLYYESWGQCWERAALIKARAVAGDRALGAAFLQEVQPFIYRRYLDYTTVDELRHMKLRIENELLTGDDKERNLKLGYGGIREVEFFTQALQLVNGGYEPKVRGPSTLPALAALAQGKFIATQERDKLTEAYRFLRQAEHKVQIVQEAHAHSIPEGADEEQALARRLGYRRKGKLSERELFWRDYRGHAATVRSIFDRLFYSAQKDITHQGASAAGSIWHDLDNRELITRALAKAGFADPAKAYENLLAVRDGEVYAPPSPKRLKVMRVLGPALIDAITNAGAPDQALLNLAEFSHRIGGRTGFLTLLAENPQTMRLLITLFSDSQFLTDQFLNRPELIDTLIRVDLTRLEKSKSEMLDELRSALSESSDVEDRLNALRRYKTEEFIRIGLHDLGGSIELIPALHQLSELAAACVEAALQLALAELSEKFGPVPQGRFAVIGGGKMGAREIDYNSDLDLIFVYAAPDDAVTSGGSQSKLPAHDFYVRVGQKLLTFLSAPMEEGIAYKIDMQLRPSGKSGPIVSSIEAYREYHKTASQLWERQALIKTGFIAGDTALGREAEQIIERFAYSGGLPQDGIAEIHHLRVRMERELAGEDETHFNLKKGRGGLVDIEFVTQMLQLAHGHERPALRRRQTLEALAALHDEKILKKAEYNLLSEGYLFLRRLDHRLRLERDQSIDSFEANPGRLEGIARALGYGEVKKKNLRTHSQSGTKLLRDYQSRREKIRACYERYFITNPNA
ncbi:MAG TPA: bifunctional [glutamate--ammonia ligase]-adenylyl-L-tyrosine phosphorylase/[glutamate--ammonia-ligase] adenylyltransferase, partial [Verrucomicrobiae bacterium]|nr:bifunctional [glutamate--ammonia ligase]-adenylyl-L-tyrosine phosphorylase/[glutamate--ammonia-ligase] adenylyltransferase [Verrucomicrobiae bacterium]